MLDVRPFQVGDHQAQKAATDKARGKLFAKLLRQVEVAARWWRRPGGQPHTCRRCSRRGADNSIPMDTIERAIKQGTGELEGVTYEEVTYEALLLGGVAVMVDVLTDNHPLRATVPTSATSSPRTAAPWPSRGAVAWQFDRKETIVVPRSADEEELMLTAIDAR